jgi:hypothetical protein
MRFLRRLAAMSGTAALGALLLATAAPASSHNPTGEFAPFAECPLNRLSITNCIHWVIAGGSLKLGTKTIPIKPTTIQGGYEGTGSEVEFFGAENGDTLSKTAQPLPGGLLGITAPESWPEEVQGWFNNLINEGFTGVNATIELAAPATSIALSTENLINQEGTTLGLPVKVKLDNAILGSNCYIGSSAEPIQINLTTGTSGSLAGAGGELSFNEEFTLVTVKGPRLVNGTFEAPEAEGCGGIYSSYVTPLVNSIFMLPSSAGKNSLVWEGTLEDASAEAVRASE